jgi:AraC-like DNA-binding protein
MHRKKLSCLLPPLVFGGRSAKIDDSVNEMEDRLHEVISGLKECESIADHGVFQHQSCLLNVNGMKMVATASTPVRFKINPNEDTTLMIPFYGQGNFIIDGRLIHWQSGVNALLLPNSTGSGESALQSVLMLNINPQKLESIARSMLGMNQHSQNILDLHAPRKLSLQVGRLSFETVFRQLANLLDQFSLQPELLNQTAIDDNFYRNLIVMLQPELFLDELSSTPSRKYARRLLDRVCDYVQAHLNQPITLSALERVSNMSARNLHYAFLKRYNTTPMRWVRTERLMMANNHLTSAPPGTTVTAIALSCGFTKPAAFAAYYQQHFGELPSTTLARALAR